jgi:hypothetical protein
LKAGTVGALTHISEGAEEARRLLIRSKAVSSE